MLEIKIGPSADKSNELELQQFVWTKWDPKRDTERATHNVERTQDCLNIWYNYVSKRLKRNEIAAVFLREESGAHISRLDTDEVRKILGLIANMYRVGVETTTIERTQGRFEETILLIRPFAG